MSGRNKMDREISRKSAVDRDLVPQSHVATRHTKVENHLVFIEGFLQRLLCVLRMNTGGHSPNGNNIHDPLFWPDG